MSATVPAVFNVPIRLSRANRWAVPREGADQLLVNTLTIDLILVLMVQKVAMPLGATQLTCVVFPHFAALAFLAYMGRVRLSTTRLILFMATFGLMGLLQLVGNRPVNWGSFMLGLVSYTWWILVVPTSRDSYMAFLKRFQLIGVGVVGLVFFDHVMQLAGPGMPNMNEIIPTAWNYHEYVYIQPLYWGSPFSKPNAFFFLEVSQTSQFIAMCLVIELAVFRRLKYLMLYVPGLMATFAGTGLLLVVLSLPFLAVKLLKPKYVIMACVLVPLVAATAVATGWTDVLGHRSGEIDQGGSSANARFVAPFAMMGEFMTQGDSELALVGIGAGELGYNTYVLFIPIAKVLLEYGLPCAILFFIFLNYCTFFGRAPFIVAWAGAMQYEFLNGGFLVPLMIILTYMLSGAFELPSERPRRLPRLAARDAATFSEPSMQGNGGQGAFG